jgi:hypothetical protein
VRLPLTGSSTATCPPWKTAAQARKQTRGTLALAYPDRISPYLAYHPRSIYAEILASS